MAAIASASSASFDGSAFSAAATASSAIGVVASSRSGDSASAFGIRDVDADRRRAVHGSISRSSRAEQRPRPRPLAERGEALLVDLDHGDRIGRDLPRLQRLQGVEPAGLKRRRPARLERDRRHQRRQQHGADEPDADRRRDRSSRAGRAFTVRFPARRRC
ncbi:MAG: hypothetical protein U5L03_04170 [Burkholderiaceae bacterium]|nr:hypothetical protein [Burkholderiaceae bacterium]